MARGRQHLRALITDFDNTLFDWLGAWYLSFDQLLSTIERKANVSRPLLLESVRTVHRRWGASEPSLGLIQELEALGLFTNSPPDVAWQSAAMEEYWKCRDETLVPYPTVKETIRAIRESGCAVIAYTESLEYPALRSLHRLGLDGLLTRIYVLPQKDAVTGLADAARPPERHFPRPQLTECRHGWAALRKPDPVVLQRIIRDAGIDVAETAYIGDGLMKDVLMAQGAGVTDVHAAYGDTRYSEAYDLLRHVSHWSDSDIAAERAVYAASRRVVPSHSISAFRDLMDLFDFQ